MNKIFYIMGKSASGKDSIYNKLLDSSKLKLKDVVLYTTRPIRENEVDGKTYHFVSDDKFLELQTSGKVIESRTYNVVGGKWTYFTADDGSIDLENNNYLVIGTLESYGDMIKYFGSDKLVPIYINVENGIRLKRALEREEMQPNPRYEEMCRRFIADEKDFSKDNLDKLKINNVFENIDFEKCYKEIETYIKSIIDLD